MATLNTKVLGIDFENPFILASAPPTAKIESIDKAFTLGWGGAVLKTITSENLVMIEASERYASWKNSNRICGFENIELILVDDGSPDNCGKICDDYAKKDSRIKVVHKENNGLMA